MNAYEQKQIKAIEHWKREQPGILGQIFDDFMTPITWMAEMVIPISAVQMAIEGANTAAEKTTNSSDILHASGASSIDELKSKSLRLSDNLASRVHNQVAATAGATGAALGATGVGGVTLDVAALITLSLRTIHRIGLCYGHRQLSEQLVLAILSLSSAANRKERAASLKLLHEVETIAIDEVWGDLATDTILSRVARGGAFFTARAVGKRMGNNLVKRKSLQLVPVVGSVIGGVTNIAFVTDVGWAARRVFQERWLKENGKFASDTAAA